MSTTISCPACGGAILDDGSMAGMVVSCPHCQGQVMMPGKYQPPALPPQRYSAREPTWADSVQANPPAYSPGGIKKPRKSSPPLVRAMLWWTLLAWPIIFGAFFAFGYFNEQSSWKEIGGGWYESSRKDAWYSSSLPSHSGASIQSHSMSAGWNASKFVPQGIYLAGLLPLLVIHLATRK